jgi:penicillin-binding protein 1C
MGLGMEKWVCEIGLEKWKRKMAIATRRTPPQKVRQNEQQNEWRHYFQHCWPAFGLKVFWWTSALLLTLVLAGCGSRTFGLPTTMEELQDFDVSDVQVTDLTVALGENLAAYNSQFAVRPRRGDTPLAIAEAYLREYQPGPMPRVFQTTVLYDRNGTKLAEIVEEGYRTWIPLNRISPDFVNALIATEDATFYENPGYDARRVVGAMIQNAESGSVVSGASTITMQLARQLFFNTEDRYDQTMDRKVFEMLLAQDLTLLYSKDEILEMYINMVHFGRTVYGIEAAANLYFAKSAAALTLAEASLLAGIPQAPAEFDPITNFAAIKQRQGVVLSLMVRHGFLTRSQADTVFGTELVFNPDLERPPLFAPHFVQYVTSEINRLRPDEDARRSGLRVFTTLDLPMQQLAERVVLEQVNALRSTFDLSNAALVAMRPGTAEILAMVGSADFYNTDISGQVNVATSMRQPGSAIKPILYSLAMDDLRISPTTIIWDVETNYRLDPTESYSPINYDKNFHGPVTARTALANSYNVPAVKLLAALGVERMLEGARLMGIQSLTRDTSWYGLSLTLGGGEVTLLDLTTAFHTIANAGSYVFPQSILYTTGAPDGREFVGFQAEPVQVISPEAAYLVTDILSDNRARMPAFGENSVLRLSRPAAAKTGTTTDYRDNWTEGFTRYLVVGVWAGNSDGRPMRNVSGVTGAAPIWNAFMEAVLADPRMLLLLDAPTDPDAWEFVAPDGVVRQPITCPQGIECNEEEVFDKRWLEMLGAESGVVDSAVVAPVHTVYVNRGNGNSPVGACSAEGGTERHLLRLPVGLTRELDQLANSDDLLATSLVAAPAFQDSGPNVEVDESGEPLDEEIVKRIREEQREALAWSARQRSPLYFGPCSQVEEVVRRVFGNSVRSIRIDNFNEQTVEVDGDDEGDEDEQDDNQVVGVPAVAPQQVNNQPSSSYSSAGVAHDNSCGGNFVLGSVYNKSGQLVPGVAVIYGDDQGNQNFAAAVNGAYRFAIPNADSARTIYLSLVDAAGTAVSGTVSVPHRQGGASDLGCHYVVWQGLD